jgi:hypothetical protein
LLPVDSLDQFRTIQNRVISTLPWPDEGYLNSIFGSRAELRAAYLGQFAPIPSPRWSVNDSWFRYYDGGDAEQWATYLATVLPDAVSEFERRPPSLMGFRPKPREA